MGQAAAASYRTGSHFPDSHVVWERATRFHQRRPVHARSRGRGDTWVLRHSPMIGNLATWTTRRLGHMLESPRSVRRTYCDCDDLSPDTVEWLRWSTSSGLMAGLRRSLTTWGGLGIKSP